MWNWIKGRRPLMSEANHYKSILLYYESLGFVNLEVRQGKRLARNNIRRINSGKPPIAQREVTENV